MLEKQERNLITVICTANICRSPIAEKLLQHALDKENGELEHLKVISAGLSAMEGDAASRYSAKVLETVGLDLSNHQSQLVTEDIVLSSFAIFCMTSTHKLMLETQFHSILPKHLFLIRELIPNTHEKEVPDPYGLDLEDYEACRDSIVEAIPYIINFLKKEFKCVQS